MRSLEGNHPPARRPMSRLARERFVNARTILATPPLVPEIALHVAREPYAIWQAASLAGADRPFWAFVWPGGQALARYILDRPAIVAGRHVLDLGSGSALRGVAATMCRPAACVSPGS